MPAKLSLWSRTKLRSSKVLPMSSYGWKPDKSLVALRIWWQDRRRHDYRLPARASDSGQRPAPGVAIERRHQLHVVFLIAGGCDLQFLVRSDCRRIATNCRRTGLGRFFVRRSGGLEPNLGTGNAQSGARCLPGFSGLPQRSVPGESHREFHLCYRATGVDDAALYRVLQPARTRTRIPVAHRRGAWDLGLGGEWNVFRGYVFAHTQPRDHAPTIAVSYLDPGFACHGRSHGRHPDRRIFRQVLDRLACRL